MKIKDASKIIPQKDLVLVNVQEAVTEKNGVYLGQKDSGPEGIVMYLGEVEKLGPSATLDVNCPGLQIGDVAMFSQFSGHHISTDDTKSYKVIPGYDICAIVTDPNNIMESTIKPTADRLLVSVKMIDETNDGLILSKEEARDPRLTDLDYGVILKTGLSTKLGYTEGQLVAYEPWCGNIAKSRKFTGDSELKLVREDDILFIAE